MATEKVLPGPCSKRQYMYMYPEQHVDVTLFGGAAGCYDANTEFLSENGWVKFSDFSNHKVAQYNPIDNTVSYVTPLEYIKIPCKSFKRMEARGLDMCLSPEHRVPYWPTKLSTFPKVITFDEVIKRHGSSVTKGWTGQIKTTFSWSGEGLNISEGELRLQVIVQADGRIVKQGANNYTQIRVSKQRKYDRLIEICKKFGLKYKDNGVSVNTKYSNNTEYEVIVWPKYPDKVFDSKYLQCNAEQLAIIVDEVGYWDGSFVENTHHKTIRYFTKHKENADFIQLAFHASGLNTSYVVDKRDGSFTVNGTKTGNGFRSFANKDQKALVTTVESGDGFKYCFTVPTSFLIVRRSNRIFVSGNSGKSEIGVIDFLKYTDIPNFIGVMTRRTTPQLYGPGNVLSKCKRIFALAYEPHEYTWRAKDGKFVFHHSGAEIYLKHFENEQAQDNWQGIEANLYYVDEGTQFSQSMIQYIMSRMRNPNCPDVQPHMKITCNPDANHFFRKWVEPYLKEDGTPDRTKDGMIRYFSFQDGQFVWADTKEELCQVYGIDEQEALSFTFISANVFDNPVVQKINPKYVSWLKGLRGVERARLLDGNWFVTESNSGFFKKEFVHPVKLYEQDIVSYCRAWDIAGSLPSDSLPNPDWTAGVLLGKTKQGRYVVVDVIRFRARFGEVMERIIATAKSDPPGTQIILPQEPGQAGKAAGQMMIKEIIEAGFYARMRPSNKSKITRFQPFAAAAEAGLVDYVEDSWNDAYFFELEQFDGSRKNKDDQVDATSDAFITLAQSLQLPPFTLPNMTQTNPYAQ